jgi:hypothetical protein
LPACASGLSFVAATHGRAFVVCCYCSQTELLIETVSH